MSFFHQVDALVAKFQAHRAALRATAEDTGHSLKLSLLPLGEWRTRCKACGEVLQGTAEQLVGAMRAHSDAQHGKRQVMP